MGLTISDFYGMLGGLIVILFILALIVIFVYEHDRLRRER